MDKLLVFARWPEPGRVKTRLAREVGPERAAAIYRRLAENVLAIVQPLRAQGVEVRVHGDPPERLPEIREWLRAADAWLPQEGADLGARMRAAFERACADGGERVVILGTDCIEITADGLRRAFEALRAVPVVIGPARDGGYYLLGLTRVVPELFAGMAWSTDTVFRETTARLARAGRAWIALEPLNDVDRLADLPPDFGPPPRSETGKQRSTGETTAMPPFTRLTPALCDRLRACVDAQGFLVARADVEKYASDETEDLVYWPEAVLRPTATAQVAAVLRLCNEQRIPVTPRGGGTGLSGGALAVHGGVCLCLERMDRIVEIDTDNLMAVVEPGVILEVFQTEVEKLGLFYPPDPASRGSCLMGGNVGHGSGGPRAVKYGVTKDYVYGLEAVLPTGEVLRTGGKLIKNSTGYNLTQLLVGSEGTLAVVTQIIVKLLPLPRYSRLALAPFDSADAAAHTIASFFHHKIIPTALEYLERAAVVAAEERLGRKYPVPPCAALLLIALDGNDAGLLDAETQRVGELCLAGGATDVFLADTPEKQQEIWALRRTTGEAVKSISVYKEEDTVVPRRRLPDLVRGIAEITQRHGIRAISYGHAGDGNLHCNILKGDMSDERWQNDLPGAIAEIFRMVVDLGGTISGEHGVGLVQRPYLGIAKSETELALLRRIKAAFDPNGILNPGKIFESQLGDCRL